MAAWTSGCGGRMDPGRGVVRVTYTVRRPMRATVRELLGHLDRVDFSGVPRDGVGWFVTTIEETGFAERMAADEKWFAAKAPGVAGVHANYQLPDSAPATAAVLREEHN